MVSWIIVGVLIVLVIIFLKYRHYQHRFYTVLILILILFFYFTASTVLSKRGIDLKTFDGVMQAGKIYLSWLWGVLGNVKNILGNVISDVFKVNWMGNLTSGG